MIAHRFACLKNPTSSDLPQDKREFIVALELYIEYLPTNSYQFLIGIHKQQPTAEAENA